MEHDYGNALLMWIIEGDNNHLNYNVQNISYDFESGTTNENYDSIMTIEGIALEIAHGYSDNLDAGGAAGRVAIDIRAFDNIDKIYCSYNEYDEPQLDGILLTSEDYVNYSSLENVFTIGANLSSMTGYFGVVNLAYWHPQHDMTTAPSALMEYMPELGDLHLIEGFAELYQQAINMPTTTFADYLVTSVDDFGDITICYDNLEDIKALILAKVSTYSF